MEDKLYNIGDCNSSQGIVKCLNVFIQQQYPVSEGLYVLQTTC